MGTENPMVNAIRAAVLAELVGLCDGGINRFTMVLELNGTAFRGPRFNSRMEGPLPPH
jgi:hypothetical protein